MSKRVCPECGAVENEDTYRRYQARIEAAEREAEQYQELAAQRAEERDEAEATLAAVREWAAALLGSYPHEDSLKLQVRGILAILDGEGEK